jgi:pimeloyl-ACP methyl ester carboxylesterase
MKTVLFVPGFQEDMKSRDYPSTIAAIEKKGYAVKFVPINWMHTTIEQWVEQLDEVYSKHDPKDTVLAGFSYGSMTAFMSATKRNPSELWLFSLSPYFAEDLVSKHMKATWLKGIGHRRVTAFSKLNFKTLARQIQCKTFLFVGQLEIDKFPGIGVRATESHRLLKASKLFVIPESGHDVSDAHYIKTITESI